MKNEYNALSDNSVRLLGNGQSIRFWTDAWCGEPLINLITTQNHVIDEEVKVSNFINGLHWNIPQEFQNFCPQMNYLVMQVTIPQQAKKDELVWKHVNNGSLSLK